MKLKTTLVVNGMSCEHCKRSVTEALARLPGVVAVEVDLPNKRVAIEHDASAGLEELTRAIETIGFQVE